MLTLAHHWPQDYLTYTSQGLPKSGTIPRFQRGLPQKRNIKDVRKVIAVSSAKGGVGKSTVAGKSLIISLLDSITNTSSSKPLPSLCPSRLPRGNPRRRHLWPLYPDPLQPQRGAPSLRKQPARAPLQLWRQDHVHGLPSRRLSARSMAWSHIDEGYTTAAS